MRVQGLPKVEASLPEDASVPPPPRRGALLVLALAVWLLATGALWAVTPASTPPRPPAATAR